MALERQCSFYRSRETLNAGCGIGYCDLDGNQTVCDGDTQFCEKPDAMRKQLEQKRDEILENRGEEVQKKKSSKYKVLVVDDEEPLRNMVVAFLSREGHQCVTASNGVEALNKIHEDNVDAVITDIVMPQMNGIALTRELLRVYSKLPVILLEGGRSGLFLC